MAKKEEILDGVINVMFMIKQSLLRQNHRQILSMAKIGLLHLIAEHPMLTMKDIAGHIGVTMPSASVLVDELEGRHLIRRISSLKDRRVTHIALTDGGKSLLKKEIDKINRRIKEVFGKLTKDDQKRLFEIYKKIYLITNNKINRK
jgi:MarR family 2-MHQ and catechol resistance regulon transcriptional repressor